MTPSSMNGLISPKSKPSVPFLLVGRESLFSTGAFARSPPRPCSGMEPFFYHIPWQPHISQMPSVACLVPTTSPTPPPPVAMRLAHLSVVLVIHGLYTRTVTPL